MTTRLSLPLLVLFSWATGVAAHQSDTTGYAQFRVSGAMVRYSLTLSAIPPGLFIDRAFLAA